MANIEEKVQELLQKKIENIGYELYDVLYLKEGKDYILRIIIDKVGGITIEDCEKVNNEINDVLDEANYIKDAYLLEVSSPGIERLLRKDWQLKKYIGEMVKVNLFKKDEKGFKEHNGILKEVTSEHIVVKEDDNDYIIPRNDIAQTKTVYINE